MDNPQYIFSIRFRYSFKLGMSVYSLLSEKYDMFGADSVV